MTEFTNSLYILENNNEIDILYNNNEIDILEEAPLIPLSANGITNQAYIPTRRDIKDDKENEFKKRFEQLSEKIISPLPVQKISSWGELQNKINNIIKHKLREYYNEDFINDVKEVKEVKVSDIDDTSAYVSNFESLLQRLIEKRSKLIIESDRVLRENSDILIKQSEQEQKNMLDNTVDKRIFEKYNFNLNDLQSQLLLYEKASIDVAKELTSKKEVLEDINSDIFNIIKWIVDIPEIIKKNKDLNLIHDTVVKQLHDYFEKHDYKLLLDEYKKSYVDFLYLMTHSDNIFKNQNKCTICLTNDITHTLSPCGHCFCLSCSNKIQLNRCHICRQITKSRIKLHF
jgi:ribosome biogenesis protein Nip4